MKRLKDIALFAEPSDIGSEVFRLALAGNDLCQVNAIDDVRRMVRWLAPCEYYERCYIKAIYTDGTSDVIPPVRFSQMRRRQTFSMDTEDCLPAA